MNSLAYVCRPVMRNSWVNEIPFVFYIGFMALQRAWHLYKTRGVFSLLMKLSWHVCTNWPNGSLATARDNVNNYVNNTNNFNRIVSVVVIMIEMLFLMRALTLILIIVLVRMLMLLLMLMLVLILVLILILRLIHTDTYTGIDTSYWY